MHAYLTAECEQCVGDLGDVFLFPEVDGLEHVDVGDTIRLYGRLEANGENIFIIRDFFVTETVEFHRLWLPQSVLYMHCAQKTQISLEPKVQITHYLCISEFCNSHRIHTF